nr:MAG TPA: hypothetical protein [Caudoviricetes sp.]
MRLSGAESFKAIMLRLEIIKESRAHDDEIKERLNAQISQIESGDTGGYTHEEMRVRANQYLF